MHVACLSHTYLITTWRPVAEANCKDSMIPRPLHFIWLSDDNRRPDQLIQTWVDQHPDREIKPWSNDDLVQPPPGDSNASCAIRW